MTPPHDSVRLLPLTHAPVTNRNKVIGSLSWTCVDYFFFFGMSLVPYLGETDICPSSSEKRHSSKAITVVVWDRCMCKVHCSPNVRKLYVGDAEAKGQE